MPNDYYFKLGQRLSEARKAAHLTQMEVSDALCISQSLLSLIERGASTVQVELLASLLYLYHCDGVWLLTGRGERQRAN